MKAVIKSVLEEAPEGLNRKKLLKLCVSKLIKEESIDEDEAKAQYGDAFESLLKKSKILEDDSGVVKLPGSTGETTEKVAAKRARSNSDAAESTQPASAAASSSKTSKKKAKSTSSADDVDKSNWPRELWRTGEQLWRENGFDSEYLRSNPENITRLFCGNLSKNITEEQMKSFIDGIVYIKWITDKETKQFYGSTFIEVRDPKAAVEAVMKDKQKFMGR
jgi:hypothetical protein